MRVPVILFAAGRPQNRRHKNNNDDGNHEKWGIDVHGVQGSLPIPEYQWSVISGQSSMVGSRAESGLTAEN
jgi:hypothetical protein